MSPTKPEWMGKHPCTFCQTGFGECAQGALVNLKCCKDCAHPTRWTTKPPYTDEEIHEMTKGRLRS